ncbi:heat shock protein 104 homeolog f [Epichloe bromicola]|uniref:Heat shock protein 104 homeolog f n=1 Tax=Epichloe bromicola TaxID=79588 RepID=A0ABQ0D0P1_9HYPO
MELVFLRPLGLRLGRVIDARNCIVIMTSNIGAEFLQRPTTKSGKIDDTTKSLVKSALENYFLPEFLNRISATIIFNRLSKGEIRKIVEVRLEEIQKRMDLNGRTVKIECEPEVKEWLGAAGYSPNYGARPLSRLIESEVLNKLAVMLLRGSILDGETARVTLDKGAIKILPNHECLGDSATEEEMEIDDLEETDESQAMELYD